MYADDVALLTKALRRSRVIATTTPSNCHYRKQLHVRQRDADHDVNQVRPPPIHFAVCPPPLHVSPLVPAIAIPAHYPPPLQLPFNSPYRHPTLQLALPLPYRYPTVQVWVVATAQSRSEAGYSDLRARTCDSNLWRLWLLQLARRDHSCVLTSWMA